MSGADGPPRAGVGELGSRAVAAFSLAVRAHPAAAAGSGVAALVTGLSPVLLALLTKIILDRLGRGASTGQVLAPAVALGAMALITVALPYVTSYLSSQLRRRVQVVTSARLFRSIAGWPGLNRFESPTFYDQLRLGQQAGEIAPQRLVGGGLVVVQNLITFVGFVVVLLALSPVISVIVVVAALPAIRVNLALSRRQATVQWWNSPAARRVQFYSGLLSGVAAAKEIRLFGLHRNLRDRMHAEMGTVNEAERQAELKGLWGNLGLALLGAAVAGAGIVWTVRGAAIGQLTLGDVSVFIAALAGTQAALSSMVQRYADLHEFLLTFGHFLEITRAGPDMALAAAPTPVPELRRGIEFRDVWFRYDAALPWVLSGVNLVIPAGASLGLVGLNGAGKSTLIKLLCRFYDPQHGRIRWDGVDLRDMDPAELRDRITAVFQDFVSYELTAADNIGLGDVSLLEDRDRLEAAARTAGVHDTLVGLPNGYDTMLSRIYVTRRGTDETEQGTLLSAGQ